MNFFFEYEKKSTNMHHVPQRWLACTIIIIRPNDGVAMSGKVVMVSRRMCAVRRKNSGGRKAE
jgi:hypothetical protein